MSTFTRFFVVVSLLAASSAARAQTPAFPDAGGGAETARFHFGPLSLTPSIALSNLGVDDNVFNEPIDPKSDSTAAFGPAGDFWMRLGPSRMKVRTSTQYLYYKKYDNQRSWNSSNEGRWDLPLTRITPFLTGAYTNTRQRPGYEIDSRAHERLWDIGAGTSLRLSGKTQMIVSASRTTVAFDEDEAFLGVDLANALNRRSNHEEVQFHDLLTPLTTFVLKASAVQDRFDNAPTRDTDSIRIMPGLEFKPAALVSGSAYVGFRRFNVLSDIVNDYNGLVAAVNVRYTIRRTQFAVSAGRDLEYSYEAKQPYYTVSDTALTLTQRISRTWDLLARGGWQRLAYKNLTSDPSLAKRTDHGSMYGGGTGYRVGETVRLGFDANYYRRDAPDATNFRDYHGFRVSGSISYGLQQ